MTFWPCFCSFCSAGVLFQISPQEALWKCGASIVKETMHFTDVEIAWYLGNTTWLSELSGLFAVHTTWLSVLWLLCFARYMTDEQQAVSHILYILWLFQCHFSGIMFCYFAMVDRSKYYSMYETRPALQLKKRVVKFEGQTCVHFSQITSLYILGSIVGVFTCNNESFWIHKWFDPSLCLDFFTRLLSFVNNDSTRRVPCNQSHRSAPTVSWVTLSMRN